MTVAEHLRRLKQATNAEAAAVVNRDGRVLAADLPTSVSQDTFSIMCAAILGAGTTAATELGHGAPRRVRLESDDGMILIREVGRRAMLILVVGSAQAPSALEAEIAHFVASFGKEFE